MWINRFRRYWLASAAALVILFASSPNTAHPHAWIDLTSTVIFDESGWVTGLRLVWVFDDFYTLFVLEGFDIDGDGKVEPERLRELAATNLRNLSEYSYFTFVQSDDQPVAVGTVTDFDTLMRKGRLVLSFTVPLAEALDPAAASVSYAVYDPTYYIEVLHVGSASIVMEGQAAERCSFALIEPSPSLEAIAGAAALDRNQPVSQGLGAFFAQRIELTCNPG